MKTPKFVMSDAEKAMRRHLDRSGKIRDKGLLKWIKGLSKPLEDCRTPLERRIQQRLEGRDVEPKTQIMQQMG
jgi:hypothetical protein